MSDETTVGQPQAESPSPATETPAQPVTQTPPIQEEKLPEKFAGKSAEEIASHYLELEKKLGEQGREIGELKAQRVPQYQPQPQWYPQPSYPPEPRVEFDYGKPEESVERIVEKRLEQERQNRATYEVQRQEQEARLNYESGKDVAVKGNPRLYEGIEPQVEQAIQMAYRQYGLHPAALRDPRVWERAAQNIRLERGEFDRLTKPGVQPPQPSHTAVPNQTRTEARVGVELDDDIRHLAKELKLSEQEAREIIEKERDYSGGGR